MSKITLYRHPLSGHCHRVELLLSILNLKYDLVDVDLRAGEHKQPNFLQKNPFGQVPVLEDGSDVISDSNAILVYLATKYDTQCRWLPSDVLTAARVQQFLSISSGPIASGPAASRLVNVFGVRLDQEQAKQIAKQILSSLDLHLQKRHWLAASHATLADIANYAYIAHAPEGDVSLEPYHALKSWLRRIEAIPGFVGMKATA